MTTDLPGIPSSLSTSIGSRQPSNTNYLRNNGFVFVMQRIPTVQYFCQGFTLPDIAFNEINQPTRFVNVKHPPTKLALESFKITFIIDENMVNWREIYDWMRSIVNIEDANNFISPSDHFSDATLVVLNSASRENVRFKFKSCFPTSISGIDFASSSTDTSPIMATATFAYDSFTVEKV